MTVLFYLNNVTGGGETVFPVADNRTYDEMVRASGVFYYSWAGRAVGKCVHTLPGMRTHLPVFPPANLGCPLLRWQAVHKQPCFVAYRV